MSFENSQNWAENTQPLVEAKNEFKKLQESPQVDVDKLISARKNISEWYTHEMEKNNTHQVRVSEFAANLNENDTKNLCLNMEDIFRQCGVSHFQAA